MAAQPQQQSGDNSMAPVWIMVALFVAAYFLWSMGHQYIVMVVFKLNLIQAKLVTFFVNSPELQQNIYLMQTVNPKAIDWKKLMEVTGAVGTFTRYPVSLVLFLLAAYLYKSNVILKYRRVHSMKTLRAQEQENWPGIMPVIAEDLVNADINEGKWAMALTPMDFARKYHLLKKDDALMENPVPGLEMTAGIRRGDAKRIFTLQLGPYWEGFSRCPPHVKALAAVFMARVNRDSKTASQILRELSTSYTKGKLETTLSDGVIKKYEKTEVIQMVLTRHAYLLTVMAELLVAARADGVVPSSEFLWLKPVDRRLWYMLNCVGRQTPYSEVAGPFAHWKAERVLGTPSVVPMIDEAVKAFELAIKEVKLTPKELGGLKP